MNFDIDNFISHINDDKKIIFVKRILDKVRIVQKNHNIETTGFLDPYEVRIAKYMLNSFDDISYDIDGGYEDAERKIIYIYPSYLYEIEKDDLKYISYKMIDGISHKNILGSLIGLGIDRKVIGDIIISDNYFYVFVKSHIYDFLKYNLEKISHYNIENVDVELNIPEKVFNERRVIISSLRLDTFLSSALNLSRNNVEKLIKADHVKVNFKPEEKPSLALLEGDLLSVKRYGRIYFDKIISTTKKNKYLVNIKIPK